MGQTDWTRTDARIWIRRNQLHRRNLDTLTRCEIALGLEGDLREKAAKNQAEAGRERVAGAIRDKAGQLLQISAKAIAPELDLGQKPKAAPAPKVAIKPVDTRKEIAAAAGVSHDTIDKAKVVLASATDAAKDAIRSGKSTINKEYKTIITADRKAVQIEAVTMGLAKPWCWAHRPQHDQSQEGGEQAPPLARGGGG